MANGRRTLIAKRGNCRHCNVSIEWFFKSSQQLCKLCSDKKCRKAKPEKYRQAYTRCYERNSSKYIKKNKIYKKNRLATDLEYRLRKNLRARISNILRGKPKGGSAIKDLGCSMEEFKSYLESKWQPGMNWDNYGFYGWHIDHIVPLVSFNLLNKVEFLKACHHTNLQPLWATENIKKGGHIWH